MGNRLTPNACIEVLDSVFIHASNTRMVLFRAILYLCLLALPASGAQPVTRLADLRALSVEQAGRHLPVRIQGVVLGLEPSTRYQFFLHDGTAGCFVRPSPGGSPPELAAGTRVLVEGASDPLGYYPSVRTARVKILGQGTLPPPAQPTASQMFAPELDSAWVEVPAVVVGYEMGDERLTLAVEVHGLPFKAELPITPDAADRAAALMQRPVRLRGIMGTIFNRQRQMTDRHFFVSSFDSITPTLPQANGESCPLLTVDRLLTGGFGPTALVRLQGVVTQQTSKGFYLRDTSGSTLVQAAKASHFKPGTPVEVEGFGALAPFRPVVRATRVHATGQAVPVLPVSFDFQAADLPALHSEWITLDADFLGRRDGPVDGILQFRSGEQFFEALHPRNSQNVEPTLAVGDRVRLTGICELTTTHALPRMTWVDGFRIHLPPSGGMEILSRSPWWNPRRLFIALGLASSLAVMGMVWTWVLRRRVKTQMAVIGEKLQAEAVGEERDRMARELHDTLEQQLSGVALQLDGLDYAVQHNPTAAAATLSLARRMLRYTRLEARRSVWDLRSKVLEDHGLAAALRAIAESSGTATRGPAIAVSVSGDEHPLAAGADFHLLRIAQEAITNAIKHAKARNIALELDYLPAETRLTIRDDGRGFDPAAAKSPGPHFGLLGMRERAAKIGAALTLDASPGKGCAVTVLIPNGSSIQSQ